MAPKIERKALLKSLQRNITERHGFGEMTDDNFLKRKQNKNFRKDEQARCGSGVVFRKLSLGLLKYFPNKLFFSFN